MCRCMGSHFYDWIDNNACGCIFNRVPERVRMGSQIVGSLGVRKFWLVGFENGKIHGNKGSYRKKCSAVDLI